MHVSKYILPQPRVILHTVVGSILLAVDQHLRVEELAVVSSADLIDRLRQSANVSLQDILVLHVCRCVPTGRGRRR